MIEEYRELIKGSKFVYLWASQILSQLTINILNFLILTELFTITGSAIATSLLWVAYALPTIFFGPLAAATIDMVEKRKVLMITNLLQAILVFVFALSHETRFFLFYGVVLAYSLLNQFYVPAESASIPSIAQKKYFAFANGLFVLTQQGALILGFGLASMLKSLLGFTNTIFLCAFFLFAAFVSVSFLPHMAASDKIPKKLEKALATFFSRIVEGYDLIKGDKRILVPFATLFVLWIMLAVVIVNVPIIATEIFKISTTSSGILLVAPAGLGALIGGITIPKILKFGIRKRRVIEVSLILITLVFFTISNLTPRLSSNYGLLLGIAAVVIAGYSFMGVFIPTQTFLQEKTPGGFRGRVFGNFWFITHLATVIPVFISGTLVEVFSIRTLLNILGVLVIVAIIVSYKFGQRVISAKVAIAKR